MTTQASALTIAGRRRKGPSIGRIAAWTALILTILIILVPFWWMIRTALSTKTVRCMPTQPRRCRSASPRSIQAGAGPGRRQCVAGSRRLGPGAEFLPVPAQLGDRDRADRRRSAVFQRTGSLCLRAAEIPAARADLFSLHRRADGARHRHADPELYPDARPGLAEHLPGDRRSQHSDVAVRGVFPAPVLPGHQPRGRGGCQDRRRLTVRESSGALSCRSAGRR